MSHGLFGGALSLDIPDYLEDGSRFRVIPDNQEVFVEGSGHLNRSLIIEIAEIQAQLCEEEIGAFFFSDYAAECSARKFQVTSEEKINLNINGLTCTRITVLGCLEMNRQSVNLGLTIFRLPEVASDILVVFNSPGISVDEAEHRRLVDSFQVHDRSLFI